MQIINLRRYLVRGVKDLIKIHNHLKKYKSL